MNYLEEMSIRSVREYNLLVQPHTQPKLYKLRFVLFSGLLGEDDGMPSFRRFSAAQRVQVEVNASQCVRRTLARNAESNLGGSRRWEIAEREALLPCPPALPTRARAKHAVDDDLDEDRLDRGSARERAAALNHVDFELAPHAV
jgi:hypothetical protein